MALVLCTGVDPVLMKTRQMILEQAGHTVFTGSDERDLKKACEKRKFNVVVVGQNTSPAVKQRIFRLIRESCPSAKVLELYRQFSEKAIQDADACLAMPTEVPQELAEVVTSLAGNGASK